MPEQDEKSVFKTIEGLTPVSADKMEAFRKTVEERVIPKIERVVKERRLQAAQSRLRLKFWT
jgi:hypothetical protein